MNYRITIEFSVDNDETDQEPPTKEKIIQCIYATGRIIPKGILYDIKDLEVERF